jgi:hypothetical protein
VTPESCRGRSAARLHDARRHDRLGVLPRRNADWRADVPEGDGGRDRWRRRRRIRCGGT